MKPKIIGINKIVNKFYAALEKLPSTDIDNLLTDDYEIQIDVKKIKVVAEKSVSDDLSSDEMNDIINKLDSFIDSLIAREYLTKFKRKDLDDIAKRLDIFFKKIDKTDDILNKILNATVSAKLNTNAILGSKPIEIK